MRISSESLKQICGFSSLIVNQTNYLLRRSIERSLRQVEARVEPFGILSQASLIRSSHFLGKRRIALSENLSIRPLDNVQWV